MTIAVSETLDKAAKSRPALTPAAIVRHLIGMNETYRQANALSKLDGRLLDDVGLTPKDVEAELRRVGYLR